MSSREGKRRFSEDGEEVAAGALAGVVEAGSPLPELNKGALFFSLQNSN